MTKVCFVFSDLKNSNGVSKAAIAIANLLVEHKNVDVTLIPIYEYEDKMAQNADPRVKIKKVFGFYFRGFDKIVGLIPHKLLYNWIVKPGDYDIEIGFQYNMPTKIIAASSNDKAAHIAWIHTYDKGLRLRSFYEKMDKVICVAKYGSDMFRKEITKNIESDYCYNPVNDKRIMTMCNEPIDIERPKGFLFVSVARHSPEKGYERLLKIVSRLKQEGYYFNMWLIGDGPSHNSLIEMASQLNINDNVKFLGNQINPHKYTVCGDVFVCSSYSEGYSTACTESIILGVPVITTPVGGGEEIIEASKVGILTQMDDESLYQGLKEVLDNPMLVDKWKSKLKETRINFLEEERSKKLYDIIDWATELHERKCSKSDN